MKKSLHLLKSLSGIVGLIGIWQVTAGSQSLPKFMLPSPVDVVMAAKNNWQLLLYHSQMTLLEAFLGLGIGIILDLILALLMERFPLIKEMFYPVLIISQTIPTVAIAPLLVLWFGYGILPKVVIVVISSLFPIAIGLLVGFQSVDPDEIQLLRAMQATDHHLITYAKLPHSILQLSDFGNLRFSWCSGCGTLSRN